MVDLKSFLPGRDDKKKENYWSIIIEPGWVQAGIWKIEGDKAQISAVSPESHWELDEDLASATDTVLSAAIQSFSEEEKEPGSAVFGVSSSWVENGDIKKEFLEKIKNLCTELSVKPIGFVVLSEAVSHLIKSEEGSPLSAVVIGVYKENLEISLFKFGKLVGTTTVSRSVSVEDDVAEGLSRFSKGDFLQSRFILYDGREGELEETRQLLLKVNWQDLEDLKLLHTPKIEIVDSKRKMYAVCLAGASELANVVKIEDLSPGEEISERVETGFAEKTLKGESSKDLTNEDKFAEGLGFMLEKDIKEQIPRDHRQNIEEVSRPENLREYSGAVNVPQRSNLGKRTPLMIENKLSGIKDSVKRFNPFKYNFLGGGSKSFLPGLATLGLIIVGAFLFWWFYPKANVTLYVAPKNLEERIPVTISSDVLSSDFSQKVLSAKVVENSVSGEKTKDATGTKVVGEKARGEVTLFRVGSEMKVSSGTKISGPDSLRFILDLDVTVASGSASSPGQNSVPVSAEDIGAQYNLAGGTSFSVANFSTSDIEAKSEDAFSGGSSREVIAVSAEDQKELESDLFSELIQNSKLELGKDLEADDFFIESFLTATASARNFSHKVGDESDILTLALTLETNALAVKKSDLINFVKEALSDKVPQGFVLRDEQMNFVFDQKDRAGDGYEFDLRISANLLPEIDTSDISQKIKGRYYGASLEILKRAVPGFVRAEIKVSPTFPGRLKTLPHIEKRIEVELAAER